MSTKSVFTCAALAVSCVLSAGAVHAQAPYNPWYAPSYSAAPAYGATPNCPTGNCGIPRTSYYSPAYSSCPSGNCGRTGNCANGQCARTGCANGRCALTGCANGQCSMNGCPNGNCGSASNTRYYAPATSVYPTQPSYFRTAPYSAPSYNWSTSNYRPTYDPWMAGVGTNRMFNSSNSPFYP